MPFNAKWFSLKAGLNVAASPDTAGSAAIGGLYCCTIGVCADRSEVVLLIGYSGGFVESGGAKGLSGPAFRNGRKVTMGGRPHAGAKG